MFRLVVILAVAYIFNYVDRNSVAYAGLTMNKALGLTATQFGWASGITLFSYTLLEVPSTLAMRKIGARIWLSRIMITWGIAASATALAIGPSSLYAFRLLLGAAEAGFFPGVVMYLSAWFPAAYRTQVLAWFLLAIPASSVVSGPLAAIFLGLDGYWNIAGWQWMFLLEGLPAVMIGVVCYWVLVDDPHEARWLTPREKAALLGALSNEQRDRPPNDLRDALLDIRVTVLAVIQFGFTLGSYGIGIWLPLILQGHGLSATQIGLISAPPYIVAGIGMLLWARYVDHVGGRIPHLTVSCLLAAAGLIASVAFSGLNPSLLAFTVALIGVSSARAIFWTIPPRFLVGRAAAGGFALINSIGLLGGFVGPFIMGWLKDRTGSFDIGLLMMSVVLLVSAGFAASLRLFMSDERA